jgi:hypothetical protein
MMRFCFIVYVDMRKLISSIFYIIPAILIIVFIATLPATGQLINCYEQEVSSMSGLDFTTNMNNLSKQDICKSRFSVIDTLSTCVDTVKSTNKLPEKLYDYIYIYLPHVRPDVKPIAGMKNSHDQDCKDFPGYIFNPQ